MSALTPQPLDRSYRGSYRKTVLLAGAVSALCLLVVGIVAGFFGAVPATIAGLFLVPLACFASMVAAGGLIGLSRDALEERGLPYFTPRPRERAPGALTRLRRWVLGILPQSPRRLRLRPGEWVQVRSQAEIAATLDAAGALDGLPFMPEMLRYCGRRFRVHRRLDKIHDYVHRTGVRRVRDTVLLDELRCAGDAHGQCQAACQLIWKEAWLRIDTTAAEPAEEKVHEALQTQLTRSATRVEADGSLRYVCQMTEFFHASSPMSWSDPRHYLRDLWCGNLRLQPWLVGVSLALFNAVQVRRGGVIAPWLPSNDRKTSPHEVLDLQPGEWVRVKTTTEIERTLNAGSKNRGLWFDREMQRFCGGRYRVHSRVERLVGEKDGKLINFSNPCIVLEGVTSGCEYLAFCPQNELIYWREIWLERSAG